jgi:hypothetical protein
LAQGIDGYKLTVLLELTCMADARYIASGRFQENATVPILGFALDCGALAALGSILVGGRGEE